MKQRGYILPIILFIFLVVGLAAYFFYQKGLFGLDKIKTTVLNVKPSASPAKEAANSSLKSYQNEEWKFIFEYPSDWVLNVTPKEKWSLGHYLFTLHDPANAQYDATKTSIIEGVTLSLNIISLDKFDVGVFDELLTDEAGSIADYSNEFIKGKITSKINSDVRESYQKIIYIDKNNYRFLFNLIWSIDVPDGEQKLDRIMSSFRFTE